MMDEVQINYLCDEIHTFRSGDYVMCPKCGREFGWIHEIKVYS